MFACKKEQLINENNKAATNKWSQKKTKYHEINDSA